MTYKELKELIEVEVSAVIGTTMSEPAPPAPKKVRRKTELSEEELDEIIFSNQNAKKDKEELKKLKTQI